MKRWHEERSLMLRRWKFEMELHGYDWRNPPDPKCDKWACHCASGIGSMRKQRPLDGAGFWRGYCKCDWCTRRFRTKGVRRRVRQAAINDEW